MLKRMRRGVLLIGLAAMALPAQEAPSTQTAADVMIERSKAALNDLQFARADSLAREVLAVGNRVRRSSRIAALQVIAAANYPEIAEERKLPAARSALTEVIKLDLGATIPRDMSWPGLDSLWQDVAATIFAMSVTHRRDNPITGIDGTSLIRVRVNRPAMFRLIARSRDGIDVITLDSVPVATDTTLALRVARNGRPILRGGEYEFVVSATSPATREVITRRYDGITIVPSIEYVNLPAIIDSTLLLPERAARQRVGAIVGGIVMGAATVALGEGLRQKDPLRSANVTDTRYRTAAGLIVVGSVAAGWFDLGRFLDKNRVTNDRRRREYEGRLRTARADNERRATDYRASIALDGEGR